MKKIILFLISLIIIEASAVVTYMFFESEFATYSLNRISTAMADEVAADDSTADDAVKIEKVILDVPVICQLPELPRGCEVTSLAMMLNFAGVEVDKMELAREIKKVPYSRDGLKGDIREGFVGSMYSLDEPGLGVYHKPVAELADRYLPYRIVDFTGEDFYWVIKYIDRGRPVWVVNNVTFNVLPEDRWEPWQTAKGRIMITRWEHSVLVTGYDSQYIYFNDPLTGEKNRPMPRAEFIEGWNQMGKQAITYSR